MRTSKETVRTEMARLADLMMSTIANGRQGRPMFVAYRDDEHLFSVMAFPEQDENNYADWTPFTGWFSRARTDCWVTASDAWMRKIEGTEIDEYLDNNRPSTDPESVEVIQLLAAIADRDAEGDKYDRLCVRITYDRDDEGKPLFHPPRQDWNEGDMGGGVPDALLGGLFISPAEFSETEEEAVLMVAGELRKELPTRHNDLAVVLAEMMKAGHMVVLPSGKMLAPPGFSVTPD